MNYSYKFGKSAIGVSGALTIFYTGIPITAKYLVLITESKVNFRLVIHLLTVKIQLNRQSDIPHRREEDERGYNHIK